MNRYAIQVENLGKEYIIGGAEQRHDSFREMLYGALAAPLRRLRRLGGRANQEERFWALRGIDFAISPGEVVGVIGHNGAGKSTLLKILSRITAPTTGRVLTCGRVASLLEVGTGFHPELTARENIYLNGAILGMSRIEIRRNFDAIVEFAQITQFLDTPVKRFSSGMYVRLAFSVAAHLDPDILLVDEVLAVGDVEFQKKCLNKLGQVSREGRTILFVSHNLQAIKVLCPRVILLDKGSIRRDGSAIQCIDLYLGERVTNSSGQWLSAEGIGNDEVRLVRLAVGQGRSDSNSFISEREIVVELDVDVAEPTPDLCVGFDLLDEFDNVVLRAYQTDQANHSAQVLEKGQWRLSCRLPPKFLNAGIFRVAPRIGVHNQYWIVNEPTLISFDLTLTHGESPYWASLSWRARPGPVACVFAWKVGSI